MIQDMFEAIEREDYPKWDVFVQLMSPDEAEGYEWNIFDMTKLGTQRLSFAKNRSSYHES